MEELFSCVIGEGFMKGLGEFAKGEERRRCLLKQAMEILRWAHGIAESLCDQKVKPWGRAFQILAHTSGGFDHGMSPPDGDS